MTVRLLEESERAQAVALLRAHEESSLFLLNNLQHGLRPTEAANSGNVYGIFDSAALSAVFMLTRRGVLLLQSDRSRDFTREILDQLARDPFTLAGVLADHALAAPVWTEMKRRAPGLRASFESKEILFRKKLAPEHFESPAGVETRTIEARDYEPWRRCRLAYLEEEGLKQDLTEAQLKDSFLKLVEERGCWVLFREGLLLATAALNARFDSVGQVGGVYTVPKARAQRLSTQVMRRMMEDCQKIHAIEKLILFTGEQNRAAQRLYDGLGFARIGHFGMFFG